jgi:hypothetical protein
VNGRHGRRAAVIRYTAARHALNENYITETAAGIDCETAEGTRLNTECWEAGQALPRWLVWLIDWRVSRRQQLWPRLAEAERQGGFR